MLDGGAAVRAAGRPGSRNVLISFAKPEAEDPRLGFSNWNSCSVSTLYRTVITLVNQLYRAAYNVTHEQTVIA